MKGGNLPRKCRVPLLSPTITQAVVFYLLSSLPQLAVGFNNSPDMYYTWCHKDWCSESALKTSGLCDYQNLTCWLTFLITEEGSAFCEQCGFMMVPHRQRLSCKSWFHARKKWLYTEKCWSKRLIQTWDLLADPQLSWGSEADWHQTSHLEQSFLDWNRKSVTDFLSLATKTPVLPWLQVRPHWLCRAQQVLLSWTWSHAEKPPQKPPQSLGCHQKLKVELHNPEWNFFSTLITQTRHVGHVGHTASLHRHAGGESAQWLGATFRHVGDQCLATATSMLLFSKPLASGSITEVTFWAFHGLGKSILEMWRTLHDRVIKMVFYQWRRQEGKMQL